MEFPRGKPIFVDQFEIQNKKQIYVFFKRSKNQDAPNQSFLLYTNKKDPEDVLHSFYFDKKETQLLEAILGSEKEADKEALHKFIIEMYVEGKKGLTNEKDKELFSPLKNIYYSQSKLAAIRKKVAHNIDENLGTKLEEKKLAKPLKKMEKAVSDKLFGKVKE